MRPSVASDVAISREVKLKTGWPKSIKWKLPSSDQSFAGHELLAGLELSAQYLQESESGCLGVANRSVACSLCSAVVAFYTSDAC